MQELTQDTQPIRQLKNADVNFETARPTAWTLPCEIFTSLAQWKNTSTQVEHKTQLWLWQQLTVLYSCSQKLVKWWDKCINVLGDCVKN